MAVMDKGPGRDELRGLSTLDGRDGPALAITEAELRARVANLLETALLTGNAAPLANAAERHSMTRPLGSPAPPASAAYRGQPGVVRWRRTPIIALAVIATTTAAAAAAYRGEWVIGWLRSEPVEHAALTPHPRRGASPASPRASEGPPLGAPPVDLPLASPSPASIPSIPPAPEASALDEAPRPPRARRPRLARPPRPSPPVRKAPGEAHLEREPMRFEAMAVDALEQANTARRAGRYADALDTYSSVVERYPNSLQAQAARVAAAALWLERFHDTRAAERLYANALARGGELAVEARHGLAEVYRARGDGARERAALVAIVQAHPQHPLADTARARLRDVPR